MIKIKPKIECGIIHWEVYVNGAFFCSEDSYDDAYKTMKEIRQNGIS